ncbi:hypothetical protein LWI29_008752 [Acer saccharum]|uniref:TIR domain-containing protein n=1 Tax=Acer saccharum TaxID=4024 RepID=A0AA39VIQ9_ACESA|nr:hypothetical protein LWI29_008752 [Acer saccharum]
MLTSLLLLRRSTVVDIATVPVVHRRILVLLSGSIFNFSSGNKHAINPPMAASIKSSKSSSSSSGSNIQWKFNGNIRATDDESSSSPSKRQKSSSASASVSNSQWKYDVFLSFRGEDTRNNFTGHLYNALKHRGIYTFRDDERLERGKEISSELLEAIEESRCSIVILSENYASSTWCLDELSKIVECMDSQKHTVFPVFYKDNPEKVKRWRSALKQVGKLAGWDLKDGSEANLIEDIVGNISRRLINLLPSVIEEQLVGIEFRVEEIYKLLELELDDRVTFVGICGMGGIGKTTIARVVYERLSNKYEGLSFLRELDVSDCNLLEIPSDIGSLCSLVVLELGGNNFVSLPDSISQLSRLYYLNLDECPRLQSLPKLPPKLGFVGADHCTSLKTISSALELTSECVTLQFFNCFQLVETQGMNISLVIMLLKRWLQGFVRHLCYDFKGDDHLWLAYFSKYTLDRNKDGEYDCGKGVTASLAVACDYKYRNWVKRCGIRPVYKQDVEYLKELSTTDGAITMPSTLQGSRSRKCTHCIKKEINAGSMISAKRLIWIVRKRQRQAAMGRVDRISLPTATAEVDVESCSKASLAEKGHFVIYTLNRKRFVIPIAYLSNDIFRELKMV